MVTDWSPDALIEFKCDVFSKRSNSGSFVTASQARGGRPMRIIRPRSGLIENVFGIIFHARSFKDGFVLIFKGLCCVMGLLIGYVSHHGCDRRGADANCAVSILPGEKAVRSADAERRVAFNVTQNLGDGTRGRNRNEQMDMVNRAADRKEINSRGTAYRLDGGPDFFWFGYQWQTALGAEHGVDVIDVVGMCHGSGPLRGQFAFLNRLPRACEAVTKLPEFERLEKNVAFKFD